MTANIFDKALLIANDLPSLDKWLSIKRLIRLNCNHMLELDIPDGENIIKHYISNASDIKGHNICVEVLGVQFIVKKNMAETLNNVWAENYLCHISRDENNNCIAWTPTAQITFIDTAQPRLLTFDGKNGDSCVSQYFEGFTAINNPTYKKFKNFNL